LLEEEDFQGFKGGQLAWVDGEREFQGPIQKISFGGNGTVSVICTWGAQLDRESGKLEVSSDSSVTHAFDLSTGLWRKDGSELYHNPHKCVPNLAECPFPEHLTHTFHFYPPKSIMENRVKKLAVVGSAALAAAALGFFGVRIIKQKRRRKSRRENEGRESSE